MLLVGVLFFSVVCHAQKASIRKVEIAGQKIIVHYDLEDTNPGNEYQVQLYSSLNDFATALTKVRGDVGNEIKSGSDKTIEWDITQEIGPYKGRLSLELRGHVFLPVARINSVTAGDRYKRGTSILINWRAGNANPVNVQLLKDGAPVLTEVNRPNSGSFSLAIPAHSKIGKDYTVRITDTRNPEDFTVSPPFAVKRKIPLGLKVLPVAVVGGVLMLISQPKSPDGIPDPPDPE